MSIANYLTALDAQRDQLARNLVTMGVQASESEKLNTLVPKVLQIPSGRPEVTLFRNGNDALTTYGECIYTFYIDGKQIGNKVTGAVSHTEQFILVGTEIIGHRTAIPGITNELKGAVRHVENDCFIVDYVRVFDFEE